MSTMLEIFSPAFDKIIGTMDLRVIDNEKLRRRSPADSFHSLASIKKDRGAVSDFVIENYNKDEFSTRQAQTDLFWDPRTIKYRNDCANLIGNMALALTNHLSHTRVSDANHSDKSLNPLGQEMTESVSVFVQQSAACLNKIGVSGLTASSICSFLELCIPTQRISKDDHKLSNLETFQKNLASECTRKFITLTPDQVQRIHNLMLHNPQKDRFLQNALYSFPAQYRFKPRTSKPASGENDLRENI